MLLSELLSELEYELIQGRLDTEVKDIIYDSRKVLRSTAFVCICGTIVDSHNFLADVLKRGASVIVIERPVEEVFPEGITVIMVPSGRKALALLAAAYFGQPAKKMITVGVTGTKGKTTTTHMIKAILENAGKKVGMIGTNGISVNGTFYAATHTTPESYQLQKYLSEMVDAGCEYLVMEASSQGFLMHRVDGIFFDYGIFTNISPDHIGPGEHADFEEYLACKSELFKRCKVGIMNQDDPHVDEILQGHTCRVCSYGVKQAADFKVDRIDYLTDEDFVGIGFHVKGRTELEVKVNIPGEFNVYNALAATSLAVLLNISGAVIQETMKSVVVNGRMEIVHASGRCTIIVDYAHNAVSMESLLTTLRMYHPKRLVCVFGCGGNRSKLRRYEMGEIGGRLADLAVITADNSRFEQVEDILADIKTGLAKTTGKYIEIPDRKEAIRHCIMNAQPGDMVVIIGKGHEDYQEIKGVRYPFSDRAVVEEVLASI